ncbi:MAG: tRNA (guanine(46)-N(7))-methyltransferase TrmB [Verrucomicrobia bacterium]|nr:tRNA (guanine(46)-N(7))-methyltransferase TrmB [Verrucomicrobiota bacterium]
MKPKNLKCPFTWKDRRPVIHDHILYVPEYYQEHEKYTFPGWESPDVFGRAAPIEVEYCTGNGAWIVEKAIAYPDRNWVAVEIQFERVRKIWSKIHNFNLKNLFIVCGEGLTFTRYYVPDHSFSAAYVNFPDPWPKDKHAKNRILQEPFLTEMARALKPGSIATIATDHVEYSRQIIEGMNANPLWESCYPDPYFVREFEGYGSSFFEALWRERGIPVHYMQYATQGKR